jgi:hypothetical protein
VCRANSIFEHTGNLLTISMTLDGWKFTVFS